MITPADNPHLSDQTHAALRLADALVERDQALIGLRDLLDPSRRLSTWALAGVISDRLRRFQATAYPRIQAGYREPQNSLETALLACVCGECPGSQRRLADLLATLRL